MHDKQRRAMFAKSRSPVGFKLRTDLSSDEKESANTSITRGGKLSMPFKKIEPELKKKETIYDMGAGRGIDYLHMKKEGLKASACDPNTELGECKVKKSDVVISNFVLNTVRPRPRKKILDKIEESTKDRAYITVRRKGSGGKKSSENSS